MSSLFKGWAAKVLNQKPRTKPAITNGWFGIVNQYGNLSEVRSSHTMARVDLVTPSA